MARETSRWRRSDVTFGPFGRVAATLLLCVLPILWAAGYSPVMLIIWTFVVSPLLLRSIWKKARVHT